MSAAIAAAQGHDLTGRTRTCARASTTVKACSDERPRMISHHCAPVGVPSTPTRGVRLAIAMSGTIDTPVTI
ncbi:hypothetical protein AB7828_29585 [Tardiphaga sp. 215_C5_N2_1]|uniref:hypothetical protein n=1 Tax=Tardiphaga sp. 215_C5_N2_1 TaxID=3240774 RepID=UPI003F8C0C02